MDGDTSIDGATVGPGPTRNDSAAGGPSGSSGGPGRSGGLTPAAVLSALGYRLVALVPPLVLHGALYALPSWVTAVDAALLLATLVVGAPALLVEVGVRALPRLRGAG